VPRFSDEQVRAIITQPTKLRTVQYPGHPDLLVAVRQLDDVELDGCRIEGQRKLRDLCKLRRWDVVQAAELDPTLLERWVEREIVLRAFFDNDTKDAEHPIPFFSGEQDLVRLGSVGVTDLMMVYTENQEWQNPNVTLSPEEEKDLVDALGKEQSAGLYLTGIEPAILRRLLISTVKRLYDCRTGKSSTSRSADSTTAVG
jgi:hypothetical protein